MTTFTNNFYINYQKRYLLKYDDIKENHKMKKLKKVNSNSIKSRLVVVFIALILISMSVLGIASYNVSKKALADLGESALTNKVNMGLSFMKVLEKQVEDGKLTRKAAQEIFKSDMLNPKNKDGKTRNQNSKLELNIGAYMYAIDSHGIEMMHPSKEGTNISKVVDPKGNNIVKLITTEGRNPQNNGIIHFEWQNPGDTKIRPKTNAVGYFKPWDWYLNVGAYDEDFYKPANTVLNIIILISIISLAIGSGIIIWFLNKKLNPLSELSKKMQQVASGDLDVDINIKSNDEIGQIQESFKKMILAQRQVISTVKESVNNVLSQSERLSSTSEEMTSSSLEVANTMQQVAQGSTSQSNDLQGIVKLMENLTINIENVHKGLENVKNETGNATERAKNGKGEMDILIRSIDDIMKAFEIVVAKLNNLKTSVNKVSDITDVITSISEQTNLLALNAAIEAARAGEAGQGFSVVADEVRKLAEKSKKSTNEISELVSSIQLDTEEVINTSNKVDVFIKSQANAVENTVNSFGEILDSVEKIPALMDKTYEGMDEIIESKEEALSKIQAVSDVTQENAAESEEVAATSEELSSASEEVSTTAQNLSETAIDLSKAVNKFKIE